MEFANVLMLFNVSGLHEYLESLTVVFHSCTSVLEGKIFNMAANTAPKMAKFHFKNLLSCKNAVVTKIAWFYQSMTCMHTQWRANHIFLWLLFFLSYFGIHTLIRAIIYICINFCSFMFSIMSYSSILCLLITILV